MGDGSGTFCPRYSKITIILGIVLTDRGRATVRRHLGPRGKPGSVQKDRVSGAHASYPNRSPVKPGLSFTAFQRNLSPNLPEEGISPTQLGSEDTCRNPFPKQGWAAA